MYIKRLAENLVQKALLLFEILSFEVYCRSDRDSPTQRYGESATPGDSPYQRYAESATPRLTDAGSRGVYKRKNESLRSLCLPVVAGISGPAKKSLSAVGYNA
jgi:hypothetical protein